MLRFEHLHSPRILGKLQSLLRSRDALTTNVVVERKAAHSFLIGKFWAVHMMVGAAVAHKRGEHGARPGDLNYLVPPVYTLTSLFVVGFTGRVSAVDAGGEISLHADSHAAAKAAASFFSRDSKT